MGQCSPCPLETLLGLERDSAHEAVAKLTAGLPAEAGAYTPLQRHPGSRTIIQDAFVRFHGILFQHSPPLLPLHEWGARGPRDRNFSNYGVPGTLMHAAMKLSEGRTAGHARPSVLPRLAHNGWIIGQAGRTLPNSTCLGWDNTEYIEVESMPGCRELWVFRFLPSSAVSSTAGAASSQEISPSPHRVQRECLTRSCATSSLSTSRGPSRRSL